MDNRSDGEKWLDEKLEEIFNRVPQWDISNFFQKGKDFAPEDIREGMVFSYKNYIINIGGMQLLKYKTNEVIGITCFVTGQMAHFTDVISMKIINKAIYIGSTKER